MEETMSLKELFGAIKKRIAIIIIFTIMAGLAVGIYTYYFITPTYQVSTQMLVNRQPNEGIVNVSEIQTNLQLINTYNVIIKTSAILDIVAKQLDEDVSSAYLNSKISVSSVGDSQIINLIVQNADPKFAEAIANTTAQVFQQEIPKLMYVDNVKILAKAVAQEGMAPINPKPMQNIVIGLAIGLMLGLGLAFLLEYLDNTIKTEQDIEKILGMSVLGIVTVMDSQSYKKNKKDKQKTAVRGETYHV